MTQVTERVKGSFALRRSFDGIETINTTTVAGTAQTVPAGEYISLNRIWRDIFDPATNTIRVIYV